MKLKLSFLLIFIVVFSPFIFALELDYWAADIVLSAAKQNLLLNDELNPNNQYLALPDESQSLSLRPEVRLRWFESSSLTFRPFFDYKNSKIKLPGPITSHKQKTKSRINEAFLSQNLSETAQLTYGLQSYQWGPAEAASPSNFIFKDTITAKDSLYTARGLHLLRLNFSPSPEWSEVLMMELSDNGDADFYENQDPFAKKALLKTEWLWGQASDYAGLVLGWQDRLGFNIGEYYSAEVHEGLYLYFDAHHTKGSNRWRPNRDAGGIISFVQDEKDSAKSFSYIVTGLRYNFENGGDFRTEFIYEEGAYNGEQQQQIRKSFTTALLAQQIYLKDNLVHLINNNLSFAGQKFMMLSYSKPNLFDKKNFLLALRGLYSMTDQSARVYLTLEKSIGKQGTIFGFIMQNTGKQFSELNSLINVAYNLGYKHSF